MILIINKKTNARLCNDGMWRGFANFGSEPNCVKEYRSMGHAHRRARHIGGHVIQLPFGATIDACGVIDQADVGTFTEFDSFIVSPKQ